MSDGHLKNHINLLLNNAEACKRLIQLGSGEETVTEMIYGISRKQQVNQAKLKIKLIYSKAPAYIMEGVIRGMDYSERLREVFDRNKEQVSLNLPLLINIDMLISE
jgi:hypothetical protein